MDWRTGLALLVVVSITLLTSAGPVPRHDPPVVSVSFIDSPPLAEGGAPLDAAAVGRDGFRR